MEILFEYSNANLAQKLAEIELVENLMYASKFSFFQKNLAFLTMQKKLQVPT